MPLSLPGSTPQPIDIEKNFELLREVLIRFPAKTPKQEDVVQAFLLLDRYWNMKLYKHMEAHTRLRRAYALDDTDSLRFMCMYIHRLSRRSSSAASCKSEYIMQLKEITASPTTSPSAASLLTMSIPLSAPRKSTSTISDCSSCPSQKAGALLLCPCQLVHAGICK